MDTNFEKIQGLLSASNLSTQEQGDFIILLSAAPDESLEALVTLFTDDSAWIRKTYDNFKAKQIAFAGKDSVAWKKILADEEAALK